MRSLSAGDDAAQPACRAGRRTRVLTGPALGGQLLNIERVDGYPGFPDGIPGYDLCPIVQEQGVAAGTEFSAASVRRLVADDGRWTVTTSEGDVQAGCVVIATGTRAKELGIPGEARLRGKGVSHCATCDGPLFRTKTVGVVGGGDSALQRRSPRCSAGSSRSARTARRSGTITGKWERIESYITNHTDAEPSHGICDVCMARHYSDYR